jgi:hypothetical protein
MVFNDRVDGEILPDVHAPVAPATLVDALRTDPEAGPDVASFVADFFNGPPTPPPATASPAAGPRVGEDAGQHGLEARTVLADGGRVSVGQPRQDL